MLSFGDLYPLYSHIGTEKFTEWAFEYAKIRQILGTCYDIKISEYDLKASYPGYYSDLAMAHLLSDQLGCLINGETKIKNEVTMNWNEGLGETEYTSFTISYWRDAQSGTALYVDTISNTAAEDLPERIVLSFNQFFGSASINAFAELSSSGIPAVGERKIKITASLSYDTMVIVAVDTAVETLTLTIPALTIDDDLRIGKISCDDVAYANQLKNRIYSILDRYCKYEHVVLNKSILSKKQCDLLFAYAMEKNVKYTTNTGHFINGSFTEDDFTFT